MNTISRHKALVLYIVFFLLSGGAFWAINIFGQSIFPGDKFFPFFIRSVMEVGLLTCCYYVNFRFSLKNALDTNFLKFRFRSILQYLGGAALAGLLIAAIWAIIYWFYPFEIIQNPDSRGNFANVIISYTLGNTLEELLFRGFLLTASIKLLGKISGVLSVSLLFGLFHLQGTGLTTPGLGMVITTFTMSLLFISVIFYTRSIWTAVTLHITGNLLLHPLGFDGADSGVFQIKFATSNVDGHIISLIFEIVVITFSLLIWVRTKKQT